MNRRGFLMGGLAATAGGILVSADVLSTRTFFLPPRGGWRNYRIKVTAQGAAQFNHYQQATLLLRDDAVTVNIGDVIGVDDHPYRVGWVYYQYT